MLISPRLTMLLASTAIAALAAGGADAQSFTQVAGGGSSLASPTYLKILTLYTNINTTADLLDFYNLSGSGAAQTAILTNTPNVPGGPKPFDYGASDATIADATQLYGSSGWNNIGTGRSSAGLLVEVPTIGTPITIPLNLNGVSSNTAINFSDGDLCNIFSGAVKQWSQITDAGVPANEGNISVAYRADGSGTSFLLTQHLAAVCPAGIGPDAITFRATTSFASLFPNSTPPSNFIPSSNNPNNLVGSPGLQYVVANTASSVGYVSPDYTQIISGPTLARGVSKAPYVARVRGVEPTSSNTQAALATGRPVTDGTVNPGGTLDYPPDPNSFIPVAANPTAGYPIVGYTTIWTAQCYTDPNVASAVSGLLSTIYSNLGARTIEASGGFSLVPSSLVTTIRNTYLTSSSSSAITVAGSGGCATVSAGR